MLLVGKRLPHAKVRSCSLKKRVDPNASEGPRRAQTYTLHSFVPTEMEMNSTTVAMTMKRLT